MKMRKMKARAVLFSLSVVVGIAQSAFARMISDISFHYTGSECIKAKVQFEKGTTGDDHVLYVVWDDVDRGGNLTDWPNANAVRVDPIAPEATEAIVELPSAVKASSVFRAFFVEPKRTGNFDKLISCIRSAGGAYINTEHCCTKNCEVMFDFAIPEYSAAKYALFGATPCGDNFTLRVAFGHDDWRWWWCYTDGGTGFTEERLDLGGTSAYAGPTRSTITVSAAEKMWRLYRKYDSSEVTGSYYYGVGTNDSPRPMYVFANCNRNNNAELIVLKGVVYAFSIKESGSYVRKMYPAVKENTPGLWDAVNDKFYPSATESPFYDVETNGVSFAECSFNQVVDDIVISREQQISVSNPDHVSARKVNSLSFSRKPSGGSRVTVGMTTGKSGEVEIAYLAWGDKDYGADSAAWPNMTRLGTLSAGETSRSFSITNEMDGTEFYRVFLATAWHPIVPKALSYIRSEGNAYIDTGYNCATNTKIKVDFQFPDCIQATIGDYFGMYSTGTKYGIRLVKVGQNRLIDYCLNKDGETTWINKIGDISLTQNYFVKTTVLGRYMNATYTADGVTDTSKTVNHSNSMKGVDRATLPLYIFASSQDSGVPLHVMPWGNLFGASIQEDGVFKRQFYPCVKDGVAGLCDQVENKFYPSAGTASFLATDTSGAAIAEGAFPVETPFTSSATVEGEYRMGFSVIVR